MTPANQTLILLALAKYVIGLQKEVAFLHAQAEDPDKEPYRRSLLAQATSVNKQMLNVRWIVLRFRDDLNEIFGTDDLSEIATFPFEEVGETLGLDIMERLPVTKLGVRKPDKKKPFIHAHP